MVNDSATVKQLTPDPAMMRHFLDILIPDGDPFEIRVLKLRRMTTDGLVPDTYNQAHSGFFVDKDRAVQHAARHTGTTCSGVYVTLNQLPRHALNWGMGRIAKGRATSDADILRIRYLYLDIDPVRPDDTNATREEQERAISRAAELEDFLSDKGWPKPAWRGRSGSGAMLLYRVGLEASEQGLIQRVLQGLDHLFSDDSASVDTGVYNLARIVRLPGSINAKAITPQSDRPWSIASGEAPPNAGLVGRWQLEEVATDPTSERHIVEKMLPRSFVAYDLPRILADSGITFREKVLTYGTAFEVDYCPNGRDHAAGGTVFIQFPSGAVTFRCLHERCKGTGWIDVRSKLKIPSISPNGILANTRRTNVGMDAYEIRGGKVVPV